MKVRLINSCKSWIWDQYLPESMKSTFGNIESNIAHLKEMQMSERVGVENPDNQGLKQN